MLGHDEAVESLCDGGFELDVKFSSTRLRELSKMDGALGPCGARGPVPGSPRPPSSSATADPRWLWRLQVPPTPTPAVANRPQPRRGLGAVSGRGKGVGGT
ncbi:hypothetical protein NLX83_11875 [Allokutzneria sp. A3M-2-11 16]|nr:hypothetical protein [Allokutzneria sp. A3M-2-11 16]